MKKVIIGRHTGLSSDGQLRFWEYDNTTSGYYMYSESNYAIVDSVYGYQLVEVVGIAEMSDDFEVTANVVMFVQLNLPSKLQKKGK